MARLDFHALNVVTHDLHWGFCDCSCVTLKPRNHLMLSMHAPTFENNIFNLHL